MSLSFFVFKNYFSYFSAVTRIKMYIKFGYIAVEENRRNLEIRWIHAIAENEHFRRENR